MGALLLVEDDILAARAAMRSLRDVAASVEVVHVTTQGAALRLVDGREDWRAFVVDIRLGADPHAGLDILDAAQRKAAKSPRAAFTGLFDPFVVDRVAALGATLLLKEARRPMPALAVFVARALSPSVANPDHAARADAYATRKRFSPRLRELLAWRVAGRTPDEYQRAKGITESTYRRQVVCALAKTKGEFDRMANLIEYILRGD